jgi:hypothetical protein
MSLPVRPHRGTAPNVEGNEFTYDVVAGDAPDPHLEFPPEQGTNDIAPTPRACLRHRARLARPTSGTAQDVDQELVRRTSNSFETQSECRPALGTASFRACPGPPDTAVGRGPEDRSHTRDGAPRCRWAFVALCFSVIGAYGAATADDVPARAMDLALGCTCARAFTSAGVAGMSWLRSLPTPRVRARLNRDLDEVHISLRLPAPNRTLMVFTGGIAVGAIDHVARSVPSAPGRVA